MNEEEWAEFHNQWKIDLPMVIMGRDPYKFPMRADLFEPPIHAEPNSSAREELRLACKRVGLSLDEMMGHRRAKGTDAPRGAVVNWMIQAYPRLSLGTIARLTNKDHTTIMYHKRAHAKRLVKREYREAWDRVQGL